MIRVELEHHLIPLKTDKQGRICLEGKGPAIRLHIGRIFIIVGIIKEIS